MRGGQREGSGRKSKAVELGLPKLIEEVIGDVGKTELITAIYNEAMKGSFPHQQLLMYYIYGKPTDNVDITSQGDKLGPTEVIFRNYAEKV